MATVVEALLGAVMLDGGEAALRQVMENLGLTHALLNTVTPFPLMLWMMQISARVDMIIETPT